MKVNPPSRSCRASPRPQPCRPAESARGLWPGARWFCRRAGRWQGCISPERRHSAGAAGCCTTLGGRRTPEEAEEKEGHQKHNAVHSDVYIRSKWDDSAPCSTCGHTVTCTATYTRQDKRYELALKSQWFDGLIYLCMEITIVEERTKKSLYQTRFPRTVTLMAEAACGLSTVSNIYVGIWRTEKRLPLMYN